MSTVGKILSKTLELLCEKIGANPTEDESSPSRAEELIQHDRSPFGPVKAEEKRSLLGAVAWAGKGLTRAQKVG